MLKIYGDSILGNCLKVKWTADLLGLEYEWIDVAVLNGETRMPTFLEMNPAGQVPVVILSDGRALAQSNAIILLLAEGSSLVPAASYERAKMLEWLFWEQYSHEPYIAVARFQVRYLKQPVESLETRLIERGNLALQRLEDVVSGSDYLGGDDLTLADVSLIAYTRTAGEGGFDLGRYPAVRSWIARVERAIGIAS